VIRTEHNPLARGVEPIPIPHFMPFLREEEGMLPRPASYVQDRSGDLSSLHLFDELFLGPADGPGRGLQR